jgi:hypothetical protein
MRLLKRWGILILIHASLTLSFLYLEWFIPFPQVGEPIGPLSSANPLLGLGATLLMGLLVGGVWGALVSTDERFKAVVIGYIVLLGAGLSAVWLSPWGWMGYLTLNEPLGYFVRSMTHRAIADQVVLGLGIFSTPLGLWIGLKSALRITQKKRQSQD